MPSIKYPRLKNDIMWLLNEWCISFLTFASDVFQVYLFGILAPISRIFTSPSEDPARDPPWVFYGLHVQHSTCDSSVVAHPLFFRPSQKTLDPELKEALPFVVKRFPSIVWSRFPFSKIITKEQGRIHGYHSRVRVGRGRYWGHQIIWAGAVK